MSVDLPEPGGPGDGDELTLLDIHVGTAQGADRDLTDGVGLDEITNGDDRHLVTSLSTSNFDPSNFEL